MTGRGLRRVLQASEVRGVVLTLIGIGIAVLVLSLGGGGNGVQVRVNLPEATGLREGTLVRVAGAVVGKIGRLQLGHGDAVIADLDLTTGVSHIGRDAKVKIETANLLGESVLELDPGHPGQMPAPPGFTIPRQHVSSNVQLDQVLDVLDPATRARLAVLINEAGYSLTGRGGDFSALLNQLPPSLDASTRLLNELISDNHTLGLAIAHSDGFVTRFAQQGQQLGHMIDVAGGTMATFAGRQRELEQTLAHAPGTLQTLQRFLENLQQTTAPLGPAAAALTAAASPLSQTLSAVEPFRTAAAPTLREARIVAPSLTRLANQATPVLAAAAPTLSSGATLFRQSPALMAAFDHGGIDSLLGFMEGWARAIQTRDGISHVFRGRALIGADLINHFLATLAPPKTAAHTQQPAQTNGNGTTTGAATPSSPSQPAATPSASPAPSSNPAPSLPQTLQGILGSVTGGLSNALHGGGASHTGTTGATSTPTQAPNGVQQLLNFLLKP